MKKLMIVGGTGFFGKSFIDCFIRKKLNKWFISKLIIISRNSNKFKRYKKNNIAVTLSQISSLMKKFLYLILMALNK